MKPESSTFAFLIAALLGLKLVKKWISLNISSIREYELNHPLEEVPPAFSIWKFVNVVVTLAIIMTIPFRCAPRHQREMKHSASSAASRNLLEWA